ncbi:Membrane-associated zinc metalloprotease [Methylophaga frappieri]|uniref:Zinc metalloprotease n=1 Tax=Methylophaga frappieri (strain ATCC BAA-2434 / DSM 25690 / JAM7) TaxID=754477 RepID=I1YG44_METFJ|nr:RIP metalloprotease RseP [Methylophaga frappieri]AFJ01887.1 Membrane-associated zinc metalloprotease [Methylophaga frappieri]
MQSLFFFIVALSLLVVVHEFGHYWVARRCGVKVLTFSVGFGKALLTRYNRHGTAFVLAALPLGGYVKMLDSRQMPVSPAETATSFDHQPLSKRTAIVFAGPLANILFAVLAYWLILVIGVPGAKPIIGSVAEGSPAALAQLQAGDEIRHIEGERAPTWRRAFELWFAAAQSGETVTIEVLSGGVTSQKKLTLPVVAVDESATLLTQVGVVPYRPEIKPILGQITPGGAADKAGLKAGDELISSDGEQITDWQSWVEHIQASAGKTLAITVQRESERRQLSVIPTADENGLGRIGVGVDTTNQTLPASLSSEMRLGPVAAVPVAFQQTWSFMRNTVVSLWGMVTGQVSADNLGGPVSIAQFAGSSAQQGVVAFIGFLAMISISLGILNLLPIPVLDGGHLLLYLIEWVKGSPVSETAQLQAQKIGLIVLLLLMSLAFANDLSRLFG